MTSQQPEGANGKDSSSATTVGIQVVSPDANGRSSPRSSTSSQRSGSGSSTHSSHDGDEGLPPPSTATPFIESWNNPRVNMWRFFATNFSFVILGANDAVYGVSKTFLFCPYNHSS